MLWERLSVGCDLPGYRRGLSPFYFRYSHKRSAWYAQPPGRKFIMHVWAKSATDARTVAQKLGFGDVQPEFDNALIEHEHRFGLGTTIILRERGLASERLAALHSMPDSKTLACIMHACTFEAWLAMRVGVLVADELLGDEGLVHAVAHAVARDSGVLNAEMLVPLVPLWEKLEKQVPGLWPYPQD